MENTHRIEIPTEQKIKLSASNIFALASVTLTLVVGYGSLVSQISTLSQRVSTNEKALEDNDNYRGKIDFKLDKIIESVNQIKVDNAEKRFQDQQYKQ